MLTLDLSGIIDQFRYELNNSITHAKMEDAIKEYLKNECNVRIFVDGIDCGD